MTKAQAHRILDRVTRGEDVSELDILCALRATGDLSPMRMFDRDEVIPPNIPIEPFPTPLKSSCV